ncbi:NAD(P)H-dependent flavin oxidoreductase [Paraburkholderia graminis]|uniref:NAD(P)H-dependent flavin oxidoreductase n=1 Tax=Paraburkholderia graminis TaxID=60548 RepID=UPI0038BA2876
MTLAASITVRLRLPLICAPVFRVSGADLVIEACNAGVIESFPTANCKTVDRFGKWLTRRDSAVPSSAAPFCPNLIMRSSSMKEELACICRHRVEMIITSVGSPAPAVDPLHEIGCLVLTDVATVRHAEKAIAAGIDGLILLTAGADGQTGWADGFAFARAVRRIFDGPIVLAGRISDGWPLWAARALGCDLAYMGTRFIAATESSAPPDYKQILVDSEFDDIFLTRAFTDLETNILPPSIVAAGLDPANLPAMSEGRSPQLCGSGAPAPQTMEGRLECRTFGFRCPSRRIRGSINQNHSG